MTVLRGSVVLHRGIERAHTEDEGLPPEAGLLLRVVLQQHGEDGDTTEVHFMGKIAVFLAALEPGDKLVVNGGEANRSGEHGDEEHVLWNVRTDNGVVQVFRQGKMTRIDKAAVDAAELPAWFRMPPTRPVDGTYLYCRYLCTLRDGVEANLWGVVWQNSMPGPAIYGEKISSNLILVDWSYKSLPCDQWVNEKGIPQFSLNVSLFGLQGDARGVAGLPFLCVGDVVRCHRVRVLGKPPRYMNLWCQKHSSLVVFGSRDVAPERVGDDAVPDEGPLSIRSITPGHASATPADYKHARSLRDWVRGRLSRETMSSYIVLASDLSQSQPSQDLVVKVLRVFPDDFVILTTDGSTRDPLRVQVADPQCAAEWLFAHLKPGYWLKLRNVKGFVDDDPRGLPPLHVSAATVTRLPLWSYDVVRRARTLNGEDDRPMVSPTALDPEPVSPMPSARDVAEAVPEPEVDDSGNMPDSKNTKGQGEGIHIPGRSDVPEAFIEPSSLMSAPGSTSQVELIEGIRVQIAGLRGRSEVNEQSGSILGFHKGSARWMVRLDCGEDKLFKAANLVATQPQGTLRPPPRRARLSTLWADTEGVPLPEGIRDVQVASTLGVRCHEIARFVVVGVSGAFASGVQAEHLLCIRCRACGEVFPRDIVGLNVTSAKRRRQCLPCGHWTFAVQYRFQLDLRDETEPDLRLSALVCEEKGEFFGVAADVAMSDTSALNQVQQLLDGLLQSGKSDATLSLCMGHTLALARMESPNQLLGSAHVVCDTHVTWV